MSFGSFHSDLLQGGKKVPLMQTECRGDSWKTELKDFFFPLWLFVVRTNYEILIICIQITWSKETKSNLLQNTVYFCIEGFSQDRQRLLCGLNEGGRGVSETGAQAGRSPDSRPQGQAAQFQVLTSSLHGT